MDISKLRGLPQLTPPPAYCQYASGPCDQDFGNVQSAAGVFLYPSAPVQIAETIEAAVERLRLARPESMWRTWRDFGPEGQVIFCEISKAVRFADSVIADVTTLNFNLLFEIGYCIGLGVPVIPIRDTTYLKSQRDFDALGVLDTIGYIDFSNSVDLADRLLKVLPGAPLPPPTDKMFKESPLYVLKGPIGTDGSIQMLSTLKKSRIGFRTYDPVEMPRLSLHEARRQVAGSVGFVAHLLSPHRRDALVHNALVALVAGIAMASEKVVALIQEEHIPQPIDYRDVVQTYSAPKQIPKLLEASILQVVENMQLADPGRVSAPSSALERMDLGDPAAENEIRGLREYFVRTGPFRQAVQGHARLVVGRKGSGKTAIFYEIRDSLGGGRSMLVLDLKPEGHQFTKLREAVLSELPEGVREHTVAAFWNYILLSEMAHKILEREQKYAQRDPDRMRRFQRLQDAYREHRTGRGDDLSQRLLRQVDRLVERYGEVGQNAMRDKLTEVIYGGDIKALDDAVSDYLQEKDAVWLLIDNLDKSWATRGTTPEDMLIVRSLLEATRKLQRQLEERQVDFKCLVFLRSDVHEHLVRETPDKDKDTAIRLDWDDPSLFEEILKRRITASTDIDGEFDAVWRALFASHVGTVDSFHYLLERTFMRPRDLLKFVQRAVEVAVNRNHALVTAEDVVQAEQAYSEDMLLMTGFEIEDTAPELADILFAFQFANRTMPHSDVDAVLESRGLEPAVRLRAIDLLVWFGVLGVAGRGEAEEDTYAYQVRYNVQRLTDAVQKGTAQFVVHPAFRASLKIT